MKPVIKTEGLTKHYYVGKKVIHALDNINLCVNEKEIMGLVGESGSGKSTFGKCIIGLENSDSGNIYFEDLNTETLSRFERKKLCQRRQMVFQNPFSSFNPKIPIGKNLMRVCRYYNFSKQDAKKRLEELMVMVNLGKEILKRLPGELSGGQLQRLALVRAMISNPKFIVADEAVSALDISVQAQVLNLFVDMRDTMDLSILFISHDLNVVQQICDRVAVLYLGQIIEIGTVSEVYDDTRHPYTESLILAKPKEHPNESKEEINFKGDGLSAVDVSEGCRFFGKCPYGKEGLCNKGIPELRKVSGEHYTSCVRDRAEWTR